MWLGSKLVSPDNPVTTEWDIYRQDVVHDTQTTMNVTINTSTHSSQYQHSTMFLSLRFNGYSPGEPRLASVILCFNFIEAKDDGSGGDNWSYRSCKAPVKSSPPTNQHPVFLQAGCPSCRPTNSVKALKYQQCSSLIICNKAFRFLRKGKWVCFTQRNKKLLWNNTTALKNLHQLILVVKHYWKMAWSHIQNVTVISNNIA